MILGRDWPVMSAIRTEVEKEPDTVGAFYERHLIRPEGSPLLKM
jgi:hypothetical protein